ncbi:MAG TPA: PEP-CTERM sorting domain-containing protein [Steroidobacteraceae bacterium]|nr:PEP-CTERM sorting domain-containing protein [Steroidobacteraceae bacterium]
MKLNSTMLWVLSAVCVAMLSPNSAHATRGIRIDNPGGGGCQLQTSGWSPSASDPNAPHDAFSPAEITVGSGDTDDSLVFCTPTSAADISSTDPTASIFGWAGSIVYNAAGLVNSSLIANGGTVYDWVPNNYSDTQRGSEYLQAQVIAWTLGNGDSELELNDWCVTGSSESASLTWFQTSLRDDCSSGAADDLLFSNTGSLIGYVTGQYSNDGVFSADLIDLSGNALPPGWSEPAGSSGSTSVPEPGTLPLLGSGLPLIALIFLRRRYRDRLPDRLAVAR